MHTTLPQTPPDFWTVIMINFQSNLPTPNRNAKKNFLMKKEFPNKKKNQKKRKGK